MLAINEDVDALPEQEYHSAFNRLSRGQTKQPRMLSTESKQRLLSIVPGAEFIFPVEEGSRPWEALKRGFNRAWRTRGKVVVATTSAVLSTHYFKEMVDGRASVIVIPTGRVKLQQDRHRSNHASVLVVYDGENLNPAHTVIKFVGERKQRLRLVA